jgi:hypothetical protein
MFRFSCNPVIQKQILFYAYKNRLKFYSEKDPQGYFVYPNDIKVSVK